jgi:hypothetical protein
MGEPDLLGFDDCGDDYAEEDSDTLEHVRHSAYWAVNTDRGQDWEEPTRWADLASFLEQRGDAGATGAAAIVGTDLEETDDRIQSASYRVQLGEVARWFANIVTARGTAAVEGTLQPLPQDAEEEPAEEMAIPGPVAAGVKSLRQFAFDFGLFPHWLLGRSSGRIVYSIALLCDTATEWLYQGIQQRFPLLAEEDALPHLGRDLGILRGLRESTEAYRKRLSLWVPAHRRAGTPFAIAEQAQAYFAPQSPNVYVVQHDPTGLTRATWSVRYSDSTETTFVESPSNWDWDSEDASRPASLDTRDPRAWLVIEQPSAGVGGIDGLFSERTSASAATRDATGMNGAVKPDGAAAPADQYRDLFAIVQQWRAMGTWVAGVIVVLGTIDPIGSGATHPDGRWFDPLNDAKDGNRIPDNVRLLYVNRFPNDQEPASPVPYTV